MNQFWLLYAFTVSFVSASFPGTTILSRTGDIELSICFPVTGNFNFDYETPSLDRIYRTACAYPPATGTLLLCSYSLSGNNTKLLPRWYKTLSATCFTHNFTAPPSYYKEQFNNATALHKTVSEIDVSKPVHYPILVNVSSLESSYTIFKNEDNNEDYATWFNVGICGYFLLLIVGSAVYNFFRYVGITKMINNWRISKAFQKFLIYPALFPNGKFVQPYGFKYFSVLFPNRIQFVTDIFIFALEVAFYCVPYKYPSPRYYANFVANRTGITAIGKIPLFILFAGRNNFLLYITGWSYSTFIHFHKVLAFWMFTDGLIHSVGYTIFYLGFYVSSLRKTVYFPCGVASMILAGMLLLNSLHTFRSYSYEFFVFFHALLALGFIITLWYHVIDYGYMEWIVAACCVWFFDRLVRVIRMSLFGFRKATITAIDDHLIKVEVKKPKWFLNPPGTYGYIYFGGLLFWENNPFSIVQNGDKLNIFIRVKKGVTQRVWKKLMKNNNQIEKRICIEGPYGGTNFSKLKLYDDTLLLAGGSGAPGILEAAIHVKSGKLVWIVQNLHFITCYQDFLNQIDIPIDIYVTQEKSTNKNYSIKELLTVSESESEMKTSESFEKVSKEYAINDNITKMEDIKYNNTQVSVKYGRPDMNDTINNYINESTAGNVGILTCGPPVMMDHIRNVISSNITSWSKSVDFFDEYQIW